MTNKHRELIKLNKKLIEKAPDFFTEGISEKELLKKLKDHFELNQKKIRFSFRPIIAFGKNSAEPHHRAGETRLKPGQAVKIDIGFKKDGLITDLTRTFFFGEKSRKNKKYVQFLEIEKHVKKAQKIAIQKIKAGTISFEPDKASRDYFKKHKLDKYFIHSLGHGVGKKIHERPYLTQNKKILSKLPLKKGDLVTVEPGLYFKDKFGYRVEDMVLVTESGVEILSK